MEKAVQGAKDREDLLGCQRSCQMKTTVGNGCAGYGNGLTGQMREAEELTRTYEIKWPYAFGPEAAPQGIMELSWIIGWVFHLEE